MDINFPSNKANHSIFTSRGGSPLLSPEKTRGLPFAGARPLQREEPPPGLHTKAMPAAEPSSRRKRFICPPPLLRHGEGDVRVCDKKAMPEDDVQHASETTDCMCGPCQLGKGRSPATHGPIFCAGRTLNQWSMRACSLGAGGQGLRVGSPHRAAGPPCRAPSELPALRPG